MGYKLPDISILEALYWRDRLTVSEIAKKYQVTEGAVYHAFREGGVSLRDRESTYRIKRERGSSPYAFSDRDRERIYQAYWGRGETLRMIGERYGVSWTCIRDTLLRFNIPLRDYSSAVELAYRRGRLQIKHEFDRGIFSTWTDRMAYLLGLVYATGQVSTNGVIFTFSTLELGRNVCHLMGSIREPKRRVRRGSTEYMIGFYSVELVRHLSFYGLTPDVKAFTMSFPSIPFEYLSHFLRGFWDGRGVGGGGSIWFFSDSFNFISQIPAALIRCDSNISSGTWHTGGKDTQRIDNYGDKAYRLFYTDIKDIESIYRIFYDDLEEDEIYYRGKRDEFEEVIEQKRAIRG